MRTTTYQHPENSSELGDKCGWEGRWGGVRVKCSNGATGTGGLDVFFSSRAGGR